jgi:hypothetical protein
LVHFEQTETVQKAIRDGEHFSIGGIFVGHYSDARAYGLFRGGIGGGVNFTFYAPQFFQIAAADLAALRLKIALYRFLNLN